MWENSEKIIDNKIWYFWFFSNFFEFFTIFYRIFMQIFVNKFINFIF